jgi:nucleotide-binding universal stress UspA family protein
MVEDVAMGPILLCDDGSDGAARAVQGAAELLRGREAIALHVWQSLSTGALAAAGAGVMALPPELDEQLQAGAERSAEQAAERAGAAGFDAAPLAVEAAGPVWQVIVETARTREASVIVLGARGLSGLQHALLGSVSEKVARHADRPVLVLHPPAG